MKRLVLVLAAIGFISTFAAMGHGMTLTANGQADTMALARLLIALGVPAVIGMTRGRLAVVDAIAAIACFAFVLVTLRSYLVDYVAHGPGGGRALVITAALGLVAAVIGLVQATATRGSCSRSPS